MRSDQFVGLNNRATKYLSENAIKAKHVIYVKGEIISEKEKIHVIDGKYYISEMYDDDILLGSYILNDGSRVYEYEQYCGYSSGAVHFIALKREDGTPIEETLWTEEEIENNM